MQNVTAIIYDKRGRVLSIGKNSYHKTHRIQAEFARAVGLEKKIYLHAEVDAIIRCRSIDRAHKIVVSRFYKNGNPAKARPCKICQSAIESTPIKVIEWTEGDVFDSI